MKMFVAVPMRQIRQKGLLRYASFLLCDYVSDVVFSPTKEALSLGLSGIRVREDELPDFAYEMYALTHP